MFDPGKIAGAGIGIANSLVNAIKGIKQVQEGKAIQKKLDAQGRPIEETPEAFNEIEGLVRSNYLDPRLSGETRIKDAIQAREANQFQNIQDTAGSGADALTAFGISSLNTDNNLFNVDMKAYEQQQADYNQLLGTLGQKSAIQQKQFDTNVMQPFIQDTEQAKALIAAGEQNRNSGFADIAGYAGSAFGGKTPDTKVATVDTPSETTTTTTQPTTTPLYKPITTAFANIAENVQAAQGVMGTNGNTGKQELTTGNIGQLQQLLQLFGGAKF